MLAKCKRDNELTPEKTMLVKDSQRGIRKRCKECLNAPRRKNKPTVYEMSRMATTYLHEDIEDLLSFGSTYNEILERGGFSTWDAMYRSLKRRERYDLIEQLRAKKKASV